MGSENCRVHKIIDPSPPLVRFAAQVSNCVVVGYVQHGETGGSLVCLNPVIEFFKRTGRSCKSNDMRSGIGKRFGNCSAKSAGGTGNETNRVFQRNRSSTRTSEPEQDPHEHTASLLGLSNSPETTRSVGTSSLWKGK